MKILMSIILYMIAFYSSILGTTYNCGDNNSEDVLINKIVNGYNVKINKIDITPSDVDNNGTLTIKTFANLSFKYMGKLPTKPIVFDDENNRFQPKIIIRDSIVIPNVNLIKVDSSINGDSISHYVKNVNNISDIIYLKNEDLIIKNAM